LDSTLALDLPTFLRMFQMRKGQIMWLLGAGASRAAGIKTAGDMVWEFKHKLYCSERKQPLTAIADLGDPIKHLSRLCASHSPAPRCMGPLKLVKLSVCTYVENCDGVPSDEAQLLDHRPLVARLAETAVPPT